MALHDLADPATPLPGQVVLDSSLLLALRKGDDNPNARAAHQFIRRLGQQIAQYQTVAWLLIPVLQECYHVILSRSLRRSWESMAPENRRPNWLAAYKRQPELIAAGFDNLTRFDDILAAIPLTPAQPNDLLVTPDMQSFEDRMRHFITAYYLLPQDALILAEAERLGVTAIATLDSDWRRVAEFDIYITPI
ncbi:MAG: PIN domain-containing protein [Actinomycetia bacterium]|jgi:predicted nucleic acid-binding protein|nr:PIN domain-containing protein [Actinomycetes bacterium]